MRRDQRVERLRFKHTTTGQHDAQARADLDSLERELERLRGAGEEAVREFRILRAEIAHLNQQLLEAQDAHARVAKMNDTLADRAAAAREVVEAFRGVRERAMEDGYWCDAINSGDDQDTVRLHVHADTALSHYDEVTR